MHDEAEVKLLIQKICYDVESTQSNRNGTDSLEVPEESAVNIEIDIGDDFFTGHQSLTTSEDEPAVKILKIVKPDSEIPCSSQQELDEKPEIEDPKRYSLISNMAFTCSSEGKPKDDTLKCFVPYCSVELDVKSFLLHLHDKHKKVSWNRYCVTCDEFVAPYTDNNIFYEFWHYKTEHSSDLDLEPELQILESEAGTLEWKKEPMESIWNPTSWLGSCIKDPLYSRTMMTTEKALLYKFKCMAKICFFVTSNPTEFNYHLCRHFSRSDPDNYEGWNWCAYCNFKVDSQDERLKLINHILEIHKYDNFSCSLCFYRSASPINVANHMKKFHPSKPAKVLDIQPGPRLTLESMENILFSEDNIHIDKLHCNVCKLYIFISIEDFHVHLRTHSNWKDANTQCEKLHIPKFSTDSHLEICLSVAVHQCLYCVFGAELKSNMRLHLANKHASKLPYYFCRYNQDPVSKFIICRRFQLKVYFF